MAKRFLMSKATTELVLAILLLAGCHKQPHRILLAPPAQPAASTTGPAMPAELPPPPQVDTATQPAATLPPIPTATTPPPPAAPLPTKAVKPTRVIKKENSPALAVDPPVPVPAPVPPAPQLGEILAPQDKRRLNADIDRAMRNAEASLNSVSGKALNGQQQGAAAQAASFLRQAVEIRDQDLSSARSLAQRAEVIAGDLARSVK